MIFLRPCVSVLLVATVLALPGEVALGRPAQNSSDTLPPQHPWLHWTIGSFYRSESKPAVPEGAPARDPVRLTYTLARRDAKTYTLKVEMTGQGPKVETEITKSLPRKVRTEKLKIGEKTVEATMWEETGRLDGAESTSRYWFADGYPVLVKYTEKLEKRFH